MKGFKDKSEGQPIESTTAIQTCTELISQELIDNTVIQVSK